jgi:hypothetical protein
MDGPSGPRDNKKKDTKMKNETLKFIESLIGEGTRAGYDKFSWGDEVITITFLGNEIEFKTLDRILSAIDWENAGVSFQSFDRDSQVVLTRLNKQGE